MVDPRDQLRLGFGSGIGFKISEKICITGLSPSPNSTEVSQDHSDDTTEHLLLEPGNILKLRCDTNIRPGMAVNWYKEGVRLLPTPRIQMRGAIMEITDVTYEDSGLYVCVLRGSKNPVRNFTITVAGNRNQPLAFLDRKCDCSSLVVFGSLY